MARRNSNAVDSGVDGGGMRILYVELNGSNSTLQEGLRTIVAAMRKPVEISQVPPKRIENLKATTGEEAAPPESSLFDGEDDPVEANAETVTTTASTVTRQKRGQGPKVDRNAAIAMVANLDFVPAGKTPLKEFFAAKAPTSDIDRVLVLSHYLQHTMGLSTFGLGHILTAFKHVEKKIPLDLPATVRNMKQKAWLNYSDIQSISMATEGDNRVAHVLPKNKDGAK